MGSVEQQIYASLADETLKAGHHTHAATPGLDARTIEHHEEICNHWGQYEAGSPFKRSLVHLPLFDEGAADPSHHLVILISDQGRDARGRPGAMLRHLVRMDAATFAAFDHNPFHLWRKGLLLSQWTPQTPFPVIEATTDPTSRSDLQSIFPERYALLRGLLGHLLSTGKLHLHAAEDSPAAEETLAQLLELLPPARRARLAMTTFAYANAHEYQLAVVRRAETTLRTSLEGFLGEPVEGLHDDDRAYLDRLFAALAAKDWAAAAACVHGETAPRAPAAAPASSGHVPFTHRKPTAAPAAEEDLGEWAPSFRRAGVQKKSGRSRRAIWLGALVVVLLGIAATALLQRGNGPAGPAAGRVNTRVESAADLGALVDEHARRLRTLLDQGSRDFDLAEAMRGMNARLAETVNTTLQREKDDLTAGAITTAGDPTAMALYLRTAADRVERASRRLAALETVLADADVAAVRAVAATGATGLDLGEGEPDGPLAATVAAWGVELGDASSAVRATADLSWPPVEAEWRTIAGTLAARADCDPAVAALSEAVTAQTALVANLQRDATRVGDPIVPFESTDADAARNAAANAARSWGGLPAAVLAMDTFVGLGVRASERPRGAQAKDWMAELGIATRDGGALASSLEPGRVRDWLARWRVEVLRGIAEAERGSGTWNGFAAENAEENVRVAAALDAVASAPVPAGADLVERIRQEQGRARDALHRALLADWLRRQEQGRARTGSAFEEVYGALSRAHASFVASPSPATWSQLRAQLATTESSGLDAVARDPARKSQVDAVRAFAKAIGRPVAARIDGVRVELSRRSDYSGNERSLAQLRAVLARRSDGGVVWQAGTAPVLAPPGAAFQQIAIPGGAPLQVGATDELVLVVRDEKTGMLWAHAWLDAGPRGHVLESLGGTHEVRVSDEQQRSLQESATPARPDGKGEVIARITVEVDPGYWAALAEVLPTLP